MSISTGVAFRNMRAQIVTGTGNGANDVPVKHSLGVTPSFIVPVQLGAGTGTVVPVIVTSSQTKSQFKFRGDAAGTFTFLVIA